MSLTASPRRPPAGVVAAGRRGEAVSDIVVHRPRRTVPAHVAVAAVARARHVVVAAVALVADAARRRGVAGVDVRLPRARGLAAIPITRRPAVRAAGDR